MSHNTPHVLLLMIPFAGFDRGLLEGIARYTQLHGPWIIYFSGDWQEGTWAPSDRVGKEPTRSDHRSAMVATAPLPNLRRWPATGVIGRIQTPEIARKILVPGLPIIGIDLSDEQSQPGNALSRISQIKSDGSSAGRMAAEHLLDRGFRHFGFCGYSAANWSREALEGFRSRLREQGSECDVYQPSKLGRGRRWEAEERSVIPWLKSLPKPVAVMAANDARGRQVLEACFLAGLRVPDDVAVVGADDDRLMCSLSNPPLSSVAFNTEQAGYRAAELLDQLMSGAVIQPRKIMVDPLYVVARRSTDAIAMDDRLVAAALRFIRDHAQHPIGVDDVAEQAGTSRRGLEIHFRRAMGRSIREEIQRVRLALAKQLLMETTLPVDQVSELAGFNSLPYLCNVFRHEVGLTPTQFRRGLRAP